MPLNVVQMSPGIVKDITEYSAGKNGPFWVDGNNVRFKNGYATKIGGWKNEAIFALDASGNIDAQTATSLTGSPRKMLFWRGVASGEDFLSVGTHNHLYIINNNGLYDITPTITTASLTNPFTTASGSAVITVADTSHGQQNNDFVAFTGASAVNNVAANTLNRKAGYQITLVDANSYKITTPDTANGSGAGGGSVTALYLVGKDEGLGTQTAAPALGFGAGGWGESTWGTPRTSGVTGVVIEQTNWALSLWGEDLVASVRNGQIYYWDASEGYDRAVLASSLTGASDVPTSNRVTIVSFPDRHLVSGGCNLLGTTTMDPMLVRWSDQENPVDWTPRVTNTAGDQRLELGTKIVAMIPTREEIFISTDEAVYGMAFVGPPFVFSFRLVGANCGAVGINTMMNVDGDVYWMGKSDFFLYNGAVQEIPCPVQFYVFGRMDKDQFDKNFAAHNKEFNEVTWFYVSTSNEDDNPEPDSYVSYNYRDQAWSIGTIPRNCWFDSFGFRKVPFAFSADGLLYNHEVGSDDNGAALPAHITSSPMEVSQNGDEMMLIDKIIPDVTVSGSVSCTVSSKKYPNSSTVTKGPFTLSQDTAKISMRSRGRQMSLKLDSTETGDSWSLGDFRVNVRQDGMR